MQDVVVIGGGIAGLTASYRLLRAGKRVRCLEARASAGGCVRTERSQGYLCEHGAQNFLEDADGPVQRLAQELGISDEIQWVTNTQNYIAWNRDLLRMPMQLQRLTSLTGLCRGLKETVLPRGDPGADESVAAWARRRFGEKIAQRVIEPMISSIYAGDPEQLSVAAAFSVGWTLERRHRSVILGALKEKPKHRSAASFARGMGTLTEALARQLGDSLGVDSQVRCIQPIASGGYRLAVTHCSSGNVESLRSAHVIVATPAPLAAPLFLQSDQRLAELLAGIHYAPLLSIWLGFSRDAFRGTPPEGYGVIRPHCQGQRNLGCIFCSSSFPSAAPDNRVMWRMLFGGRQDPQAVLLSDAELLTLALKELGESNLLPAVARPEFVHVVRQSPGLPQYEIGHLQRVADIHARAAQLGNLYFTGNAYHGVPVSKVIEHADATAQRVLQSTPDALAA